MSQNFCAEFARNTRYKNLYKILCIFTLVWHYILLYNKNKPLLGALVIAGGNSNGRCKSDWRDAPAG